MVAAAAEAEVAAVGAVAVVAEAALQEPPYVEHDIVRVRVAVLDRAGRYANGRVEGMRVLPTDT